MANTFSADSQFTPSTVFGNARVVMGVLSMTDGSAGSSVASGLDVIGFGLLTPKSAGAQSQYPPTLLGVNTNAAGDFKALSAGSGDTYHVFLVGR